MSSLRKVSLIKDPMIETHSNGTPFLLVLEVLVGWEIETADFTKEVF